MRGHLPQLFPSNILPGVDGDDDEPRAVFRGDAGDEGRIQDGGGVDGDLVGTGIQQSGRIVVGRNSSPDRERNIDPIRNARHLTGEGLAAFQGRADVQIDQFIGPFPGIGDSHFDRIAHLPEVDEIDSFDHLAFFHIQARDDPFHKHIRTSFRV